MTYFEIFDKDDNDLRVLEESRSVSSTLTVSFGLPGPRLVTLGSSERKNFKKATWLQKV